MTMIRFLSTALCVPALVAAQQGTHAPLTPDQIVSVVASARDPSWAPDGTKLLFTGADGALWTVAADGSPPVRLGEGGTQARYAPSGEYVAYVSEKSGAPELYVRALASGQETRLTKLGARVSSFSWSPDSRVIAFSGDRYGSHDIYTVAVPTGTTYRLTRDALHEVFPSWSPDGRSIIYQRLADSWVDRDWMEIPAGGGGGTPRRIVEDKGFMDYGQGRDVGFARVSPDGKSILIRSQRSGYRAYWVVPRAGGGPARPIDTSPLDQDEASWSPDGTAIAYVVQNNGTHGVRVVSAEGGHPIPLVAPDMGVVSAPAWSPDGTRISYLLATPTHAAELYVVRRAGGKSMQLTSAPASTSVEHSLITPRKVTYPSEDGFTINAYLYEPQGVRAGEKAPGIIYAHGGPTGHFADSYQPQVQWLAQHGYAVLAPNIRGSSGYGKAFEDANNGCWGHCDLKDIIAGVAYLKKQPFVNANKIGMTGISYGGIITMAAVGFAPGLLQAAVPQSGYGDWVSFFRYNNVLQHVKLLAYEFGGTFPEHIDAYRRASPIYNLENATTPTFVIHGVGAVTPWRPAQEEVQAGLEFVRELDRNYKTFRYKTYPGETYYVYGKENSKQVLVDILAFFDQFLKDGLIDLSAPQPAR